jgi:FtsZ-binding cell division protein ZapB
MRKENDDQNAVFACPVVSAKHAKLVLASSGHVYIVDLKSRHGTHLRKQGETTSKTLQPEVETTLTDGDVVTLGKAVGQGATLVSPVTVRIEFLRGILDMSDSPPCSLTPAEPSSLRPRKLSTGRYGLNSPISYISSPSHSSESLSSPSGSSNEAASHSEHESDIEEIPSWEELRSCVSSLRQDFPADLLGGSLLGKTTLGSLMQDICHKIADPLDLDSPQPWSPPAIAAIASIDDDDAPSSIIHLEDSRSHSPMELSTPSPSPPQAPSEPDVVGAWPPSRDDSLQPAPRRLELDESNRVKLPSMCSFGHMGSLELGSFESFPERLPSLSGFQTFVPVEDGPAITIPIPVLPSFTKARPDESQLSGHDDRGDLRDFIKTMEGRVNALQSSVTDIKNRHALTEDDLYDLQHQVDMLEPESDQLFARLEAAEDKLSTLSDLQDQVSELQSKADAESCDNFASPIADVKACADALSALVIEMKTLREETEKRVEEKIQTIQTARTEALSVIAAEVETFKSLKRKHSEIEIEVPPPAKMDIVVEEAPAAAAKPELPIEDYRHAKRPKRMMLSIAHTATAMAVGAVATWSALAFS